MSKLMKKEKTLLFEGAGYSCAEHNGVGNCRIRTKFRNKYNDIVYLELHKGEAINGSEKNKKWGKQPIAFFSHIFLMKDEKENYSLEISYLEKETIPYTQKSIVDFVNDNLGGEFQTMEVDNNNIQVHSVECVC